MTTAISGFRRQTRTYDSTQIAEIVAILINDLPGPGFLMPVAGNVVPRGWLICDGSEYSRIDLPDLFDAIGHTYGGTGDAFRVPDMRGVLLIGADASTPLGTRAGQNAVTLAEANMPAHSHSVADAGHTHTFTGDPHGHVVTDPGHAHTTTVGEVTVTPMAAGTSVLAQGSGVDLSSSSASSGVAIDDATASGTIAQSAAGITVGSTGSGSPFSIIPPVIGTNFAIKT